MGRVDVVLFILHAQRGLVHIHRGKRDQIQRFQSLLKVIDEAPAGSSSARVASLLSPVLGGNKYSRESFMETLGLAGILWVKYLPGLLQQQEKGPLRPLSFLLNRLRHITMEISRRPGSASMLSSRTSQCRLPAA